MLEDVLDELLQLLVPLDHTALDVEKVADKGTLQASVWRVEIKYRIDVFGTERLVPGAIDALNLGTSFLTLFGQFAQDVISRPLGVDPGTCTWRLSEHGVSAGNEVF